MKSNLYLCGITQNEFNNINELTKYYDYFDGLIFVDGGSTDGTKELLESRKKCGQIPYRKWTNDHDFQMNEILRCGTLKIGDWFLLRDSRERFNEEWLKNLKNIISQLENQKINSVFNYGKGFLFKYFDDMIFQGSPHWGLQGWRSNVIDFSHHWDEKKYEHTWRVPDGDNQRPVEYRFIHFLKYYFVYARSNHLLLGNEGNIELFNEKEALRKRFREYLYFKYDAVFTIEWFNNFLIKNDWKNDEFIRNCFNQEKILNDYYKYFILGQKADQIDKENIIKI